VRTLASAAVAGLAIGVVAVLVVVRPRRPDDRAVPLPSPIAVANDPLIRDTPPTAPADAAASNGLFERNRGMASDPDLAAEYDTLNDEFFANILPPPQVRWEDGLATLGHLIGEHFAVEGLTDGRMILMNPLVERDADQRRRALCHEMTHMAVWAQDQAHGPVFQERLRQLSLRGAFKGIAATDDERDAALEVLRQRRAEIDGEERALGADRGTLDRTSEAAVDAYNARVRQQQARVAAYNRLIEQYNLMISYPDGLARERLQPRGDGTVR